MSELVIGPEQCQSRVSADSPILIAHEGIEQSGNDLRLFPVGVFDLGPLDVRADQTLIDLDGRPLQHRRTREDGLDLGRARVGFEPGHVVDDVGIGLQPGRFHETRKGFIGDLCDLGGDERRGLPELRHQGPRAALEAVGVGIPCVGRLPLGRVDHQFHCFPLEAESQIEGIRQGVGVASEGSFEGFEVGDRLFDGLGGDVPRVGRWEDVLEFPAVGLGDVPACLVDQLFFGGFGRGCDRRARRRQEYDTGHRSKNSVHLFLLCRNRPEQGTPAGEGRKWDLRYNVEAKAVGRMT